MWLDEPLIIDGPVSPLLLAQAERAKDVYRSWRPILADVHIAAEPRELGSAASTAACFFTRGVDSWYSVLNGMAGAPRAAAVPITKLIYSPTADFFAGRPPSAFAHELREESTTLVREASERLGCELLVIDTNMRALVEPHRDWSHTHGAMLASMGLALGSHLARVHIGSTLQEDNLVPLGSHPQLDPLWSTERTEIVHDGADVTRVAKLRFLADHPVALNRLKVCINQSADGNCGRCSKCVRTMIGLRLVGTTTPPKTFDKPLRLRRVVRCVPVYDLQLAFHREIMDELERTPGHLMLRLALYSARAQSGPKRRIVEPFDRLLRTLAASRARGSRSARVLLAVLYRVRIWLG